MQQKLIVECNSFKVVFARIKILQPVQITSGLLNPNGIPHICLFLNRQKLRDLKFTTEDPHSEWTE